MEVSINGDSTRIDDGTTVAGLVSALELPVQRIAVEINKQLVRRADFDATILRAGDCVEIVTLVGGG